MKISQKIVATVVSLAMLLSLVAFPFSAYSADKAAELVLLAQKKRSDVTNISSKLTADMETTKNSKFSAKWVFKSIKKLEFPVPKDLTPYNEFVLTVYATDTGTFYVYFETDNKETSGTDTFGKTVKLVKGWQDISIPLSEITDIKFSPSWAAIDRCAIQSDGWNQKAQKDGMTVYIDYISLVSNPSLSDISGEYAKGSTDSASTSSSSVPASSLLKDEVGSARYYVNDFEDGKQFSVAPQITTEVDKKGNHYLLAKKDDSNPVDVRFNAVDVTRYVIFSLDIASTEIPSSSGCIVLRRSGGETTQIINFDPDGTITAGGQFIAKLDTRTGKFVHLDIAADFGKQTYSVYANGRLVEKNIKFASDPYSKNMILRIWIGSIKHDGANFMVDNVRIFDGKTPDNYENTMSPEEIRENKFNSLVGQKSPIIEYGDKAVKAVDNVNGVAMNVKSGYIYANGERTMPDTPAYIKNGRTLLPVRAVSEALGCEVSWDDATKTVTINGNAKIVIGSTDMTLPNGGSYTLDVPAEITNGRTFIPLRALCEQILGKNVFWDDRGLIVLSDDKFSMEDADVALLNNFMLYDRPSAEKLLEDFKANYAGVHPRVIYDRQEFDNLVWRYNTSSVVRRWGDNMIEMADGLLNSPHEKYVWVDTQIIDCVRNFKARMFVLYFAYEFTKDTKYIDYLIDELMACAAWEDWNAKGSMLDTGEMALGVAVGYDWAYHFLTEEQRKYLEDRLYIMATKWYHMAQYNVCDYPNFYITANTNWNAVCNTGMGIAALALMDVNPEMYSDLLEKTLVSYEAMMKEFYPDGAWFESVAYLSYLTQFIGFYVTALNTVYKTDFNISKAPGFDKSGNFYISMDGMTGYNNYHDSSNPSHLVSPYMYFFTKTFNQPELTALTMYKYDTYIKGEKGTYMKTSGDFDDVAMDRLASLMYYDPSISAASSINYPLDSYFRGPELINMRSSWTDNNGIFLSAHSGENEVNHAHLDAGSFVFDMGGERFAGDIGAESYSARYYWADENRRYFYYRANPQGHNVFVINPDKTYGQNRDGFDRFTAFESKARGAYAITSLKTTYSPYAADAQRGYMLADERRSVVIRDEIRGMKKDTNEVYWFLQLQNVDIEILDNNTVLLTKNGVKVRMQVLSDATAQEIMVTEPVIMASTFELNGDDAENRNWKRIAIKMTSGKNLNITVKFARNYDPVGDTPIVDTPLSEWSIPDGELPYLPEIPDFPLLNGINFNGQSAVKDFDPGKSYYTMVLPYGTTTAPMLEPICPPNATAEVSLPQTLPGDAVITLTSTINPVLKTYYTVFMRAANNVELSEYSGFQDGNPPSNCMDGDLATRWAVEGESYGIFTFAQPTTVSSVWIATWKAKERQLLFDIEVSEDGVNFKKVFSGMTQAKEDILEEVKIPTGSYKAIKLVMHGTTTGTWNSILEIDFS